MRSIAFVGMDVHKATITVAVAEDGRDGEIRQLGVFPHRAEVIARLVRRLADKGPELRFCVSGAFCPLGGRLDG